MIEQLNVLKERYKGYYLNKGSYRKYLMKVESANTAEVYDYFSKLTIRLEHISKCSELYSATKMYKFIEDVSNFRGDLSYISSKVFEYRGQGINKIFGETYDVVASIIEGFELEACSYLDTLDSTYSLSEDAQLIQRRSRLQKNKNVKDHIKSRSAKSAWLRNRKNYEKGIKKFHKSTAGKQFHRNLSRYNSLRNKSEDFEISEDDILVLSKGVSSMQTHIIIEIQNVLKDNVDMLNEEVTQIVEVMRDLFELFNVALMNLIEARFNGDKEIVLDVIDIINEYYQIAEATC